MEERLVASSESYTNAELPSNNSFFDFDGTNSDLARQLYFRAKAGDSASRFTNFDVPTSLQTRLDKLQLDWDDLDGIAQRALLWDSGFGLDPNDNAVQIWTLNGHSMTDLAVPQTQFEAVNCTKNVCVQPDGTDGYSNKQCTGAQMLRAARCVVEDFVDTTEIHLSMWVTGGNPVVVPTPRIRKHAWNDSLDLNSYIVFAIHTVELIAEPAWNECATADQNDGYGSLVLPCITTTNITDEINTEKQEVVGSAWVDRWLAEDYSSTSSTSSGAFNLLLLAPILGGVLVVIGLVVLVVLCKRKQHEKIPNNTFEDSPVCPESNYRGCEDLEDESLRERSTARTVEDTETATYRGLDRTIRLKSTFNGEFNAGSNFTLNTLFNSEALAGKRLPFDGLSFIKALSKGANGEVWLCDYRDQHVAVKRLLQNKPHQADEVEQFAKEIELSASMLHPNIISFVGVAWNTLSNLVMVLEYFPMGDLQAYLMKNGDLLSWGKDKIHIAVGVARALEYLHSRSPPLIHRDLKSKNILLTRALEPKIIDFGVSRGREEYSMTAGVGTPYWTEPEILEGKRYTEQADIYSFGVVLSELDTGKIPYHDALTSGGNKPRPIQILADVMAGMLRPSVSKDCPRRIRRICVACCQQDPSTRPTAARIVNMLEEAD